jgi:Protein of unknown function (DUF4058)
MPLRDHCQPPLSKRRSHSSFLVAWCCNILRDLNRSRLPSKYFAEIDAHASPRVEIDCGIFENVDRQLHPQIANGSDNAPMNVPPSWTASAPEWTMPAVLPAVFEIRVLDSERGQLVAAIELVSPANKDRPETRAAFVAKCAAYLQNGIGLVVIDTVTSHHFNLHNDLARFLSAGDKCLFADSIHIYSTVYRPIHSEKEDRFDVWPRELRVGEPLPELHLPLGTQQYVQLEMEWTYQETCLDCQIE